MEEPPEDNSGIELDKGPNITAIPDFDAIQDSFDLPVLLKVGDNLSTDEILAGGSRVLPFRSNIHEISEFTFERVDETYTDDAKELKEKGGHMVVGGYNYGQGSRDRKSVVEER